MSHRAELIAYVIFVAAALGIAALAIGLLLVRAILHLSWRVGRRLDANGRGGELLEELAKRAEGQRP